MMDISEITQATASQIDRYHESKPDGARYHLGCSLLGHQCDRWLWYSFRWAVREEFSGRMLRLFRRGQMEEDTIADDLRAIGCDLVTLDENGRQLRVDFGNQVSGSMDGLIQSGLPESPKTPHIVEMKTHSLKSFAELTKLGVQKSKPMHYAQMQLYMHGTGTTRALYYAVCKNDDGLYTERVRYDKKHAERLVKRGHWITQQQRIPEPDSADPTWYKCRFCPAHSVCHKGDAVTERNCRTCAHSVPNGEQWHCIQYNAPIPQDAQVAGCGRFELHRDMRAGGGNA